jgi:hypothetical protein
MRQFFEIKSDNAIIVKAQQIAKNDLDSVDETFYTDTVYGSYEGFEKTLRSFEGVIIGSIRKKLNDTVLLPSKGNERKILFPRKSKGIAWTMYFLDYRTNRPVLSVVVDKATTRYTYNSAVYDAAAKTYVEGTSSSKTVSDKEGLLNFVLEKLNADIERFAEA